MRARSSTLVPQVPYDAAKAKLFEHQRRLRYTEKWQYLESLRTFSAEQH